jgi:hypothetical protein
MCVIAQVYEDGTNFESNQGLVRIDTSLTNNVWQIGTPSKIYFNSAYSIPRAILTDTLNSYPLNSNSSFYISIKDENWFMGSPSVLSFYHKYDTDTLEDGGFIDVSYDGGQSWLNIIYDSTMFHCDWTPGFWYYSENFYGDYDTLSDGKNGFSGRSNGWIFSSFIWYYCIGVDQFPDSMMIRFNFISDAIRSDKEGWMIDDINLVSSECSGLLKENTGKKTIAIISPNPFTTMAELQIAGYSDEQYDLVIYNDRGEMNYVIKDIKKPGVQLGNLKLIPGLYFYEVIFEDGTLSQGKFIKL